MKKARLILIGPIFNFLSVPVGEGGKLFLQFKREGYLTLKYSSIKNKLGRFIDISFAITSKYNQYDIILLQGFGLLAFVMEDIVSKIAQLLKKPIIYTIHGGAFHEFYERHPKWCRKVLSRMTVINTPSKFLQGFLIEKGYNVEYVPNFIDLSLFPYSDEARVKHSLLWVRAFHDIYHPELAIEAVALLKDKYPDVHLTMVGPDQGTKLRCQTLIHSLGLENHITLQGVVPNHQLHEYFHKHSVYLNTTRYESFGVALVEAGACGIPIVSTNVGEIPYIWNDGQNILFAERHPKHFAEKITELFENSQLYGKLKINARKNAEQFTWENVRLYWIEKIDELTR